MLAQNSFSKSVNSEEELAAALLPRAVVDGIRCRRAFSISALRSCGSGAGRISLRSSGIIQLGRDLHEKAKVSFFDRKRVIEIIGFYSINHKGILTPRNSPFHMHFRTMDNRISGHLESVQLGPGIMVELPAKER